MPCEGLMLAKPRFQQYYVGVIDCHTPLSTKYYVGVIDHCSFFSFCGQCNTAELSSTVNNQAGIFKGNSKIMEVFFRLLCSISSFNLRVCPTRRGIFHETEANHANLCLVVNCFRGEIHQSREAGPPARPQHVARRPLAQRGPTAHGI